MHPRNNRKLSVNNGKKSKVVDKELYGQAGIRYVVNKDGVAIPNTEMSINDHFEVLNIPTELIENEIEYSDSKVNSFKVNESINNDGVSLLSELRKIIFNYFELFLSNVKYAFLSKYTLKLANTGH